MELENASRLLGINMQQLKGKSSNEIKLQPPHDVETSSTPALLVHIEARPGSQDGRGEGVCPGSCAHRTLARAGGGGARVSALGPLGRPVSFPLAAPGLAPCRGRVGSALRAKPAALLTGQGSDLSRKAQNTERHRVPALGGVFPRHEHASLPHKRDFWGKTPRSRGIGNRGRWHPS